MTLESESLRGVSKNYGRIQPSAVIPGQVITRNSSHVSSLSVNRINRALHYTLSATKPAPIDLIGDVLYGQFNFILYRSRDDGETWQAVHTFSSTTGEIKRILQLSTGNYLILTQTGVYRAESDFRSVENIITLTEGNFAEWGIDTDGTNVIIADYGVPHTGSNYLWISTNASFSFTRFEKNTLFPGDDANTHFHGVAYDPYDGKFWLNMGDLTYKSTYYSLNNGVSWTKVNAGRNVVGTNVQATTISVFPDGLILGSDSGENNGLYRILRQEDDANLSVEVVWRWPHPEVSVRGFPFRNFYDKNTGITFTAWRSDFANQPPIITWCNGYTGGILYEYEGTFSADDGIRNVVVLPSGKIVAWISLAGIDDQVLEFDKFNFSSTDISLQDTGYLLGGVVTGNSSGTAIGSDSAAISQSVAVGADSSAEAASSVAIGWSTTSGINSTTIGTNADGTGDNSVVIGNTATATLAANENIVIGAAASSAFEDSIVIGRNATNSGIQNVILAGKPVLTNTGYRQVVIGWLAESAGFQNVVVGRTAKCTGNTGTAIGNAAQAATTGLALGASAVAILGDNDVAIGNGTTTTLVDSVAVGARDVHVQDATKGVVLTSPNGTKYRITVDNAGVLSTGLV